MRRHPGPHHQHNDGECRSPRGMVGASRPMPMLVTRSIDRVEVLLAPRTTAMCRVGPGLKPERSRSVKRLFRRLGARTGASLGLIVVVVAVVAVARIAGGSRSPSPYHPQTQSAPSVASTAGDDGAVAPTPSSYADDTSVRSAASMFAVAWLRRTLPAGEWLAGIRPFATTK